MRRILLAGVCLFINCYGVIAQNRTLGVGVTTPNPNAALHVESPTGNQGFIMPRMTTEQRFASTFTGVLTDKDKGLMVFDTNLNTIFIWNGSGWQNTGEVSGGVKLTYPYVDSVTLGTGTNDLFALKYNAPEPKRIFRIENHNATNGSSALSVYTTGTGLGAYVQSANPANTSSALYATTNSDAGGAVAPVAVYGESTGTGSLGASFRITNATNNFPALYAETLGTGVSIEGVTSTGFSAIQGRATGGVSNGVTGISNSPETGSYAVLGTNSGGGPAGVFNIPNTANGSDALQVSTQGTGHAGTFFANNAASGAPALLAQTSGTGAALQAQTSSGFAAIYGRREGATNGNAGLFEIVNTANTYPALQANTSGTGAAFNARHTGVTGDAVYAEHAGGVGSAGNFRISNPANDASSIFAATNGTGAAIGASHDTDGVAFAIWKGGIKVTVMDVTTSIIPTRASAYRITSGGTAFSFGFSPTDGEVFMIYNETGSAITFSASGINNTILNGEGMTFIVFPGGAIRGF